MLLFLILGAMTATALALLVLPLLRQRGRTAPRSAYDFEVYRDQLRELEADKASGLISSAQAESARTEIERRILSTASPGSDDSQAQQASAQSRLITAFVVAVTVPIASGSLYLKFGSPKIGEGGAVTQSRMAEANAPSNDGGDMGEMIEKLSVRLERDPDDVEGWVLLSRSYAFQQRTGDAIGAMRRAVEASGGHPDLLTELGAMMVNAAQGRVSAEAASLFDQAVAKVPDHPMARYFVGLNKAQGGAGQEALDIWLDLVQTAPADAAWLPGVREQVARLASELGVDVGEALPRIAPAPAAAPGPTAEDMAAAAEMSAGDRNAMIRSMVDRLAQKLEENPNDADGWRRLARAYQVLGETEKARAALEQAKARE